MSINLKKYFKVACIIGTLVLMPKNTFSCGPFFSETLINWRKDSLQEPPPALFSKEINKIIDQTNNDLEVVENDQSKTYDDLLFESKELPEQNAKKISSLRQQNDGDKAYAIGNDLPEGIRLYTAAAVDFHNAFPNQKKDNEDKEAHKNENKVLDENAKNNLKKAQRRLLSVLALPDKQNRERILPAIYTLGRIATYFDETKLAEDYFIKTRELVKSGLPDPQGLAVASLGEQAQLHLRPGEIATAVSLYAHQLSYGSHSAEVSLKFVARKILKNTEWLTEALKDPKTQKLVFAYLYTQHVNRPYDTYDFFPDYDSFVEEENDNKSNLPEGWMPISKSGEKEHNITNTDNFENGESWWKDEKAEADAESHRLQTILQKIIDIIEKQGIENFSGIDWLAGSAYSNGLFDLAQRLVEHDKSALSFWVRAKLALHNGNKEAALAAYAEAIHAFPANELPKDSDYFEPFWGTGEENDWPNSSLTYRINTERGILQLSRGDFIQALHFLYQGSARYWQDAAYVAERVLSLEELKTFVDQNVLVPSEIERQNASENGELTPAMRIRQLLARRLMRNNRIKEAIDYFDDIELKKMANNYHDLLKKASNSWQTDFNKARVWYDVAILVRYEGMELMGYELSPDYTIWQGNYEDVDDQNYEGLEEEEIKEEFLTKTELERVKNHIANPNIRYHYRLLAAEYANKAADQLPASSEAFVAVLCKAAGWNINYSPEFATRFYKRYLNEGASVHWGNSFGHSCPDPNFDEAQRNYWLTQLKSHLHYSKKQIGSFAMIFLILGFAYYLLRFRFKKIMELILEHICRISYIK
jgi:cellulose synthase operon protein C